MKKLIISFTMCFFLCLIPTPLSSGGIGAVLAEVISDAIFDALEITSAVLKHRQSNSKSTGDNISASATSSQAPAVCSDCNTLFNSFATLSPYDQVLVLAKASPAANSALAMAGFQNARQLAIVLDSQFQGKVKSLRSQPKENIDSEISLYNPQSGIYIEPVGVFYSQKPCQGRIILHGQPGFKTYTYGSALGWEKVWNSKFVLEVSGAYTHSNLHWTDGGGNAMWNSIYLAPFFGWFNNKAFANFMVLGSINFIKNTRIVVLTNNVSRFPKARFKSYDLLLRGSGGYRFKICNTFWIQPEAAFDFLTEFIMGHKESNSGVLNLQVRSRNFYIIQPTANLRFIKEFRSKKFYYAPSIYLGWLSNIILKNDRISARFHTLNGTTYFHTIGFYRTFNQMLVGAEFYALRLENFLMTANFEADIFDRANVFTARMKFQWLF